MDKPHPLDTGGTDYTERLVALEHARWKRLLNVQAPYRWNLRRLDLGRTLDIGCGVGRNLSNLGAGSVGVDHNPDSVAVARSRGLSAFTPEEFAASQAQEWRTFDSALLAHVVEHMSSDEAENLVKTYLPCVRPAGKVVFITPQEKGYRSDRTHVRFVDFAGLRELADSLGLVLRRAYSFPFPRFAGRVFTYNEFVVVTTIHDNPLRGARAYGAVMAPPLPRVDVMIPAYGDGPLLREAVDSVLAQDSPGWRLIVIDDGPPDPGLEAFLVGFDDPRVKYHHNPVNLGINRNFQRCLDEAGSELVVLMGADDRLLRDYVRTVATVARRNPEATWIQPGVRVIDASGEVVLPLADRIKRWISPRVDSERVLGGEFLAASLLRGDWMYFPAVAFRREVVVRYGFREGYNLVLDLDLFMRMLLDGRHGVYLRHACFEYRRHVASMSSGAALTGGRFEEELVYFAEIRDAALAARWRKAARAASRHLTSRLHALTLVPSAARSRDVHLVGRLARQVFGPTPSPVPQGTTARPALRGPRLGHDTDREGGPGLPTGARTQP